MKISAWIFLKDLLPEKRSLFDKILVDTLVKKSLFKEKNMTDTFEILKKSGIDGIELLVPPNVTDRELKTVKNILDKNKVKALSIHQPLEHILRIPQKQMQRLFEISEYFNADTLVIHLSSVGRASIKNDNGIKIKKLEEKYKTRIAFENDPINPLSLFKPYSWYGKRFSSEIEAADSYITFDTTHLAQSGGDILKFYKDNKIRIRNIHLSDYRKNFLNRILLLTYDTHLPLGTGQLPIRKLLRELRKDGYGGKVTLEINGDLKSICKSIKIVKDVFYLTK